MGVPNRSPRPSSDAISHEKLKEFYRTQDFGYISPEQLNVNAAPPSNLDSLYVPLNEDGSIIPLLTDDRNIVVYSLEAAGGRAHTILGSKVSDRTGNVYRQSATFMEGND